MASPTLLPAALLLLASILCASAPHASLGLNVRASPPKKQSPPPRPKPKPSPPKTRQNPPPSKPSLPAPRSPSNRPSPRSPPTKLPPPTKSPPSAPPPSSPPPTSPPPASPPPVSPPPSLPPPASPPPTSPPPATPACQFTFRGQTFTSQRCVNVTTFLALYWTVNTADNTIDAFVRAAPGTSNGWLGFGLSPRCRMADSRVVIGFVNGGDTSQAAIRPYLVKPSTPVLEPLPSLIPPGGAAALEVSNGGSSYAMRFGLQLSGTGRQCVVFARGPDLTASQFSQSPVPGFQYHSFGRGVAHINFATGSLG